MVQSAAAIIIYSVVVVWEKAVAGNDGGCAKQAKEEDAAGARARTWSGFLQGKEGKEGEDGPGAQ